MSEAEWEADILSHYTEACCDTPIHLHGNASRSKQAANLFLAWQKQVMLQFPHWIVLAGLRKKLIFHLFSPHNGSTGVFDFLAGVVSVKVSGILSVSHPVNISDARFS